jgi:hypothetical protein
VKKKTTEKKNKREKQKTKKKIENKKKGVNRGCKSRRTPPFQPSRFLCVVVSFLLFLRRPLFFSSFFSLHLSSTLVPAAVFLRVAPLFSFAIIV